MQLIEPITDLGILRKILENASAYQKILDLQRSKHVKPLQNLRGKIMGTLFFEPSTRTKMSFETAMCRMGGQVVSASEHNSCEKGETLQDAIQTASQYVDVLVVRSSQQCSSWRYKVDKNCHIINGGDGIYHHPTQAITDLYTIDQHHKKISGLKVGIVGDLQNGRTVNSLITTLQACGNRLYLYGTKHKTLPTLDKETFKDVVPEIDVLYMTRMQSERGTNAPPPLVLDYDILQRMNDHAIVMHPMPRKEEIPNNLDSDKKCVYFEQSKNGIPVRMSILDWIFSM